MGLFKLRYSQLLVITASKIAMICGKSYSVYGDFLPVVNSTTDLNRNFLRTDKLIECCISRKQFLLIQYQPNGNASPWDNELKPQDPGSQPAFHFMIFRINKMSKLQRIDDSSENDLPASVVNQEKRFMKLIAIDGDENQEFGGFLTKFYTEEGGRVFLNFWRMSDYARYDRAIFRYLITELDTCEIP